MNREKKCMFASGLVHAALLSTFVIGSAFISGSQPPTPDQLAPLPTIQQIPEKLVDELIFNPGGAQEIGPINPVQQPAPAPAPAPAQVTPPAQKVVKPDPKPEPKVDQPKKVTPKKSQKADKTVDKKEKPKEKPAKVDLNSMRRTTQPSSSQKAKEEKEEREAAAREQAEREAAAAAWQKSINDAKNSIDSTPSTSTSGQGKSIASQAKITGASLGNGDGTGSGEAVANYAQTIRSIYNKAWRSPASLSSRSPTTTVRIVVSRNGNIQSSLIISRSGDKDLDESVQRAIDSVVRLPAFPAKSTDQTRTYTLRFNMDGTSI